MSSCYTGGRCCRPKTWLQEGLPLPCGHRIANKALWPRSYATQAERAHLTQPVDGVKAESENAASDLSTPKTKITASSPITSRQIRGKGGNSDRFYFFSPQNHCGQRLKSVSCSVLSDSLWPHELQPCQAPLSVAFPRQEYWGGLPCPDPGITLAPPALAGKLFTVWATRKALRMVAAAMKLNVTCSLEEKLW